MPFTFSHPAIVLPLKKVSGKMLSLTGLVVGSLTPDFEYFIRMKVQSVYSHTVFGLFWFDIPFGLLLTFIYHLIVRDPFITNLPEVLNRKLNPFKHFDWLAYFKKHWIIVFISIFIGAASHIFWDDFTHPNGYFVKRITLLSEKVVLGKIEVPVFTIFQHLSSIVGGIVVLLAVLSLKSDHPSQSDTKSAYWLSVGLITISILVIQIFLGLNIHQYGNIVVTVISGFLIGLILTSLSQKFAGSSKSDSLD